MFRFYLFLFIICGSVSLHSQVCHTDKSALEDKLFALPDLAFKVVENNNPDVLEYEIQLQQPLDHKNANTGHFKQRIILEHRGFDKPVIMHINGYTMAGGPKELLGLVDANYINIEHRYFGSSQPDSLNWSYLNFEQITADLHRIRQLFGQLYTNKWIGTGISKGGQTTIFYEYFYPEDLDIAIPYVAPVNNSDEDKRIYSFLADVGKKECRDKLYDVQIVALKNREKMLEWLYWYTKGQKSSFTYLGDLETAFEYLILEYPFSFWQWGFQCADIPTEGTSLQDYLAHILQVVDINFYNDKAMHFYAPLYYQGATEMGYYGYDTKDFKKYLKKLSGFPTAAFVPKGIDVKYNDDIAARVRKWLKKDADKMLFIYGELDTWSATAADIGSNYKVQKFVLPDKDHGGARYQNMPEEMQKQFTQLLMEWLR